MADIPKVTGRPETGEEKQRSQWFDQQALAAPETLDAAARTLLGLVTALIGTLFGVLTVAADPLPAYLGYPVMRSLGAASVAALLAALTGALGVLMPAKIQVSSHRLDEQAQAFARVLARKSRWLNVAAIAFGLGVGALGAVLVAALFLA